MRALRTSKSIANRRRAAPAEPAAAACRRAGSGRDPAGRGPRCAPIPPWRCCPSARPDAEGLARIEAQEDAPLSSRELDRQAVQETEVPRQGPRSARRRLARHRGHQAAVAVPSCRRPARTRARSMRECSLDSRGAAARPPPARSRRTWRSTRDPRPSESRRAARRSIRDRAGWRGRRRGLVAPAIHGRPADVEIPAGGAQQRGCRRRR